MQRNNIKNIRANLKMSQLQFANALGLQIEDVAQLEAERSRLGVALSFNIIELAKRKGINLKLIDLMLKPGEMSWQ